MPYSMANGRRSRGAAVTLKSSGATTATGTTTPVEVDGGTLRVKLDVTAASGTSPTMTVTLQTSSDNNVSDSWRTLGSALTQATGVTSQYVSFGGVDRFVRASYVIGGTTPSFTWSLVGEVR
jgi:hypothetical protein